MNNFKDRMVWQLAIEKKKMMLWSITCMLFLWSLCFYSYALIHHTRNRLVEVYEGEVWQLRQIAEQVDRVQLENTLLQQIVEQYRPVIDMVTDEDLEVIQTLTDSLDEKHSTVPRERIFYALLASMVAANYHNVDFNRAAALAWRESTFNPQAVSSANCRGLTQVSGLVWRVWGKKYSMDQFSVYNPFANAVVGIGYYRELKDSHRGNKERALAFYHGGNAAGETSFRYARHVLATAEAFRN